MMLWMKGASLMEILDVTADSSSVRINWMLFLVAIEKCASDGSKTEVCEQERCWKYKFNAAAWHKTN